MNGARVLVLGSTGLIGKQVAENLEASGAVAAIRASRNPAQVEKWRQQGLPAALLDLDDPRTFPAALEGIDRMFVATGYTSAMTHQTKTIVDAAADAGVGFIVHLGIFGNGRQTDPHFAWHELVERYIEGSGVAWCHLHPHVFMDNLLTAFRIAHARLSWPLGDRSVGWIAGEDIAAVAAKVLTEGAQTHAGKNHFLSTDVLNGVAAASILSDVLQRKIAPVVMTPDDLVALVASGKLAMPAMMEANYAMSALEWLRQTYDGRMEFSAIATDTVRQLLGREPLHLADWATRHRDELLAAI